MTIDRLARKTGMTARNIRAHQSRGLLPPPEVRGRVGYYGPDHVARLELIKEMQADGFNLEAISKLLGGAGARARRCCASPAPCASRSPRSALGWSPLEELAEPFGDADARAGAGACSTTRSRSASCTPSATTASRI